MVRKSPPLIAPALLTRMSSRPKRRTASAAVHCTPSRVLRSAEIASTLLPVSLRIEETASSRAAWFREQISTRAPSAAMTWAVARPMPLLPPVTRTVLPASSSSMVAPPRVDSDVRGVTLDQLPPGADSQSLRRRSSRRVPHRRIPPRTRWPRAAAGRAATDVWRGRQRGAVEDGVGRQLQLLPRPHAEAIGASDLVAFRDQTVPTHEAWRP